MSQFTVYENQNKDSNGTYPYFVDVQNELLISLNSRMVVPVTPIHLMGNITISKLCPKIQINDNEFILLTHQMTNVSTSALNKPVTALDVLRNDIVTAIDFFNYRDLDFNYVIMGTQYLTMLSFIHGTTSTRNIT